MTSCLYILTSCMFSLRNKIVNKAGGGSFVFPACLWSLGLTPLTCLITHICLPSSSSTCRLPGFSTHLSLVELAPSYLFSLILKNFLTPCVSCYLPAFHLLLPAILCLTSFIWALDFAPHQPSPSGFYLNKSSFYHCLCPTCGSPPGVHTRNIKEIFFPYWEINVKKQSFLKLQSSVSFILRVVTSL